MNPVSDTTLVGLRGGRFNIAGGSFAGSDPIDIEIKEVYSPIEILYAGLTTESGGRLLESGGMIYINASRNHELVELLKPIDVSIPADYVNEEMQLFKGEEKVDGSIDWVDPVMLDTNANRSSIDTGKGLFATYCASCHSMYTDLTGPALAGVEGRVNDRNILKAFIKNPAAVMAETPYFNCLKQQFGSVQPPFPDLTDRQLDNIYDYIKNETAKRPDLLKAQAMPVSIRDSNSKADTSIYYSSCFAAPCGFDTIYVETTTALANMVDAQIEATKEDSMDYQYKDPEPLEQAQREMGFTEIIGTGGRYNFTINTLGWFNVDAFSEGLKGTEIVDLKVSTEFEAKAELVVNVFFPAKKILTIGVFHKEDGLFHFEKYKGQIPLFLNDDAIVFANASIGEKLYYGITRFTVGKQNMIPVTIKESTEHELSNAFKEMKLDQVDLDIITKKRLLVPKKCEGSDGIKQ